MDFKWNPLKRKEKPESVTEKIETSGGMTEQKAGDIVDIESRVNNWTPRQKAALEYLKSNRLYAPRFKTLTPDKLDYVENFAAKPQDYIKSSSYNESAGKFSATGTTYANK